MKRSGIFFAMFFILGFTVSIFSQLTSEYDQAMWYLNDRNEVVLKTYFENEKELDALATSFIVDRIEGSSVYIYLDKESFPKFLKLQKDYEVFVNIVDVENDDNSAETPRQGVVNFPADGSPYSAYESMIKNLETTYPTMCKWFEAGKTTTDLTIWGVKVSNDPAIDQKKPRFIGTGTMHGNEQAGMHSILRLIEWLATNYSTNAQAKNIVDSVEMYFIPLVNPSGSYPGGSFNLNSSVRRTPNCADINRSFPTPSCADQGPQYPNGDKERDAIIDLNDEKLFGFGMDLHTGMTAIVCPWSSTKTTSKKHPDFDEYLYPVGETFSDKCGGGLQVGWAAPTWYLGYGTIFDYMNSVAGGGRNFCLELTSSQPCNASISESSWNKFKPGYLYFLEQIQYGIHGTIVFEGQPVKAKIAVDNHDKFETEVYSNPDFGYFVRVIQPGTFSLTITYDSYTVNIPGVVVEKDKKTDIGTIEMSGTSIQQEKNTLAKNGFTIFSNNSTLQFHNGTSEKAMFTIFSLNGAKAGSFSVNQQSSYTVNKENVSKPLVSGIYIVRAENRNTSISQRIVIR